MFTHTEGTNTVITHITHLFLALLNTNARMKGVNKKSDFLGKWHMQATLQRLAVAAGGLEAAVSSSPRCSVAVLLLAYVACGPLVLNSDRHARCWTWASPWQVLSWGRCDSCSGPVCLKSDTWSVAPLGCGKRSPQWSSSRIGCQHCQGHNTKTEVVGLELMRLYWEWLPLSFSRKLAQQRFTSPREFRPWEHHIPSHHYCCALGGCASTPSPAWVHTCACTQVAVQRALLAFRGPAKQR